MYINIMSAFPPPNDNLGIFNVNNYQYRDENALTYDTAKNYFLEFPTAQGTETFVNTNVGNRLSINGDIQFSDGTIQTTAATGGFNPTFYAYLTNNTSPFPIIYLNFDGSLWNIDDFITLRVNIQVVLDGPAYNSYTGLIDIYPYRVPTQSTPYKALLNNEINGDALFNYTNPTYAPDGRYYYCHGFDLQGFTDIPYFISTSRTKIGIAVPNSVAPLDATIGINVDIVNKGANTTPITLTGLTSYSYYDENLFN